MSLSSAMLVGFTGIKSNSVGVDTVGDNLANLNTTAFKGQRALFETLLYQTISEGSAPTATSGGNQPQQIGSGSRVGSIQRNFTQGSIESSGFPSDLAIDGEGFFVLADPDAGQAYTRDGSFRLDANQTLVSADGRAVQVFSAGANQQIDPSTLSDLVIPLGTASQAIETSQVVMNGQLDNNTNVASAGAVALSQPLVTAGGTPATAATALTDLVDANNLPLFATDDLLKINASKGGISVPESTFVVGTTGTTLGDLAQHLQSVLGINTDPSTGGTPGVRIADGTRFPAGTLVISSNVGTVNAAQLDASSIVNETGAIASPFAFSTASPAVGDGVTTSFGVFDSLGNLAEVRVRAVLESKSNTGTTWRFFAESTGDSDLSSVLGTGTIAFDPNGQFVSATGTDLSIDRAGTGAASPLSFTLDLSSLTGLTSPNGSSELIMASQDGAPAGVMSGYSIDGQGIVTASFSNQQTAVIGQVALATFPNNGGLIAESDNTFVLGPDSGDVAIVAPQTGKAGSIQAGALEKGNVQISREFVNLIQSSTGISSASRVIRVADELLQELLLIAR